MNWCTRQKHTLRTAVTAYWQGACTLDRLRSPAPFAGQLGARTLRIYPWCTVPLRCTQDQSTLSGSAEVRTTSRDLKTIFWQTGHPSCQTRDGNQLVHPDMSPLRNEVVVAAGCVYACCTTMACRCAFKLSRDDDCTHVKAALTARHIWLIH